MAQQEALTDEAHCSRQPSANQHNLPHHARLTPPSPKVRASDAIQAYDTLQQISEQAQRTALSKNNPALLKQIVQGMADSSPLKDFYVDAGALAPVLEKSGISPEEMEAILPGLNDTISPNDSLRVPVEALAAHPFPKEVLPNARIEPGAMSHAEAQALVGRHAENIERQGDEIVADKHADGKATQSSVRVGRWMHPDELDMMIKTGKVQENYSSQTRAAYPATPGTYRNAPKGDVYVEFDVPADRVMPHSHGTVRIPGPKSLDAKLAAPRGGDVSRFEMPPAANIKAH